MDGMAPAQSLDQLPPELLAAVLGHLDGAAASVSPTCLSSLACARLVSRAVEQCATPLFFERVTIPTYSTQGGHNHVFSRLLSMRRDWAATSSCAQPPGPLPAHLVKHMHFKVGAAHSLNTIIHIPRSSRVTRVCRCPMALGFCRRRSCPPLSTCNRFTSSASSLLAP